MDHIIILLQEYKYFILLPIAIFEGPIITVIAGFLVSIGQFNPLIVYALVVTGDTIGDAGLYSIGRFFSGAVNKHGPKFNVTEEKLELTKKYFNRHRKKALFFSKVFHGLGFTGLIAAGSLKIPYNRFFLTCFVTTLIQSLILLIIGILFGHAYNQIEQYLNYYKSLSIIIVICIIGYLFIRKFNITLDR